MISDISESLKGRAALVEGRSVPNIKLSGLALYKSVIAVDGSKSILPKPVALTLTPSSASFYSVGKPSLLKPR